MLLHGPYLPPPPPQIPSPLVVVTNPGASSLCATIPSPDSAALCPSKSDLVNEDHWRWLERARRAEEGLHRVGKRASCTQEWVRKLKKPPKWGKGCFEGTLWGTVQFALLCDDLSPRIKRVREISITT